MLCENKFFYLQQSTVFEQNYNDGKFVSPILTEMYETAVCITGPHPYPRRMRRTEFSVESLRTKPQRREIRVTHTVRRPYTERRKSSDHSDGKFVSSIQSSDKIITTGNLCHPDKDYTDHRTPIQKKVFGQNYNDRKFVSLRQRLYKPQKVFGQKLAYTNI